jgi:PAS domain S-box-containing protein
MIQQIMSLSNTFFILFLFGSVLINIFFMMKYLRQKRAIKEQADSAEAIKSKAQARAEVLSDIINQAGNAIVTVNADGIIQTWNRKATSIFGYSSEEICGKPISQLDIQNDPFSFTRVFNEVKESGELNQLELRKQCRDASQKELVMTVTPLKNDTSATPSFAIAMEDFTERNRLIDTLINQEKLISGIEALNRLLATLSHYINNSISAICALADLAAMDSKYNEKFITVTQTQVGRIDAVLKSLSRLVKDLNLKTREYVGQKEIMYDIEADIQGFLLTLKPTNEEKSDHSATENIK